MKILIVGSDRIDAIENYYVKYLREAGMNVYHFTSYSIFYRHYQESLLNKLMFKAGMSSIYQTINIMLFEIIATFKPEVIWIFKGMEIFPASLKKVRQMGIKLASYNPDNPFIFSGTGSGNENITQSIPLYDLHFTYNLDVKEKLETGYNARTAFLPFGYEITDEILIEASAQDEIIRACFLGNPDKYRASFLKKLADNGISIDVYGHKWNRFINHPKVKIFAAVYGPEFWKVLRKYRVQINLMRIHNPDSHNMRSFEIPGIGGIMVAPDTREHRLFFSDKEEVFLVADVRQCTSTINNILGLSKIDADVIRQKALLTCNRKGYSYKKRSDVALSELLKLMAVRR